MSDSISRQALYEYALNQKDKAITPNDIMRFPSAGGKTGKWIEVEGTRDSQGVATVRGMFKLW